MKSEVVYDTRNEQVVIGLMLVDDEIRKKLCASLKSENFVSDRHKRIFIGLKIITEKNLLPTDPTLLQVITGSYGGIDYIRKLRDLIGDKRSSLVENLQFHLKRLHYSTAKYELRVVEIPHIIDLLDDEMVESDHLKRELRKLIKYSESLTGKVYSETGTTIIDEYRMRKNADLGFRTTGFEELDNGCNDENCLTVGTAPGKICVIAARPSVGKSVFGTQLARRLHKNGESVNYCAWEMGKVSITDILATQWIYEQRQNGVDYPDIRLNGVVKGYYKEHYAIREALDAIYGDGRFYVMPNPAFDRNIYGSLKIYSSRDINEIRMDTLESEISNSKADVFVFDLWEKILASTKPDDITMALNRMQWMADHYKKCFIILQQINREYSKSVKSSTIPRAPKMEDIKNAGAYEETADWILTLHRPGLYNKSIPDDTLELYCRKQRMGPWPWAVSYAFNGAYSAIYGKGNRIPVDIDEPLKEDKDGGSVF